MKNNETKKIAIIHDHVSWPGGGERTALIMAEELGADFITAYANDGVYEDYRERLGERFIVLSKGEIKERGTHSELINLKGMYYNLCSLQGMAE